MKALAFMLVAGVCLFAQTASFPTSIASDSDLLVGKDRSTSRLAESISSEATSFDVLSGSQFVQYQTITIDSEQMQVTNISTNTLTVTRGFNGTNAVPHAGNAVVYGNITSYHHNALREEIQAIETALGANLSNVSGAGTDSVGTDEIDDGADTPASGEWVQVDTGDQAGFTYRSDAEALADLGIQYFQTTGPSQARTYTFPDANATVEVQANKDAASGYAGLDAGAKLASSVGEEVWGFGDLDNVTEDSPTDKDVAQYVTDHWENQTLAEAGIAPVSTTLSAAAVIADNALVQGAGGARGTDASTLTANLVSIDSGVISAGEYGDTVALFGGGSCSGYLKSDGTCDTPGGAGTVTHTAGALTADLPVFGNGTDDIKVGTKTGTGNELATSTLPVFAGMSVSGTTKVGIGGTDEYFASLISGDLDSAARGGYHWYLDTNGNGSADDVLWTAYQGDVPGGSLTRLWSVTHDGRWGFDAVTDPGARFHLPAGTATAKTAPLLFTDGTNLTVPVAGAFEFSSGVLHFTPASDRMDVLMKSAAGLFTINQASDTVETIYGKRYTDSTPTGNFFLFKNAAEDTVLARLDVDGILYVKGIDVDGSGDGIELYDVSSPAAPDTSGYTRIYTTSGALKSRAYGGSEVSYVNTGDITNMVTAAGTLTSNLPVLGGGSKAVAVGTLTGTGTELVASQSPTIVAPTIASMTNAQHSHQDAAGGGALSAAAITSGTIADSVTASKYKTWQVHYKFWGTGTSYVLQDTDDEASIWRNEESARTITKVVCESDAGSPTMQLQRDDGSPANMFASALTCDATPSGTDGSDGILTSFSGTENAIAATNRIDHLTVTAGGTATWVAVTISGTID
jgi:hypothetical protein